MYLKRITVFLILAVLSACLGRFSGASLGVVYATPNQIAVGAVDQADPTVKPLLGVISGPDPNGSFSGPSLTAQYQEIGVLSVRNNDYYDDRLDMEGIFNCGGPAYPSWEGCDPHDEANYHWAASDAQFQSYWSGGFAPFLRLGGEWNT